MAFFNASNSTAFNSPSESNVVEQDSINSRSSDAQFLCLGYVHLNTPGEIPLVEKDRSTKFIPGQLSVNKCVTKIKRTYITPNRFRAHNHTSSSNILEQNSLSKGFVLTKKIEKTTEYFFLPPPSISTHRHLISSHASHHPQTSSINEYNVSPHHAQDHQLGYPKFSMSTSNLMNHSFLSNSAPHGEAHHSHPNQTTNQPKPKPHGKDVAIDDDVVSMVPGDVNSISNMNHANRFMDLIGDDGDAATGRAKKSKSGRTHSLPHPKHGPYTCPKCSEVYQTSQNFAAHMRTHYKSESLEERNERLGARFNEKRSFRFVGSSSSSESTTMWARGQYKVKSECAHLPPIITNITGEDWRKFQSMEETASSHSNV